MMQGIHKSFELIKLEHGGNNYEKCPVIQELIDKVKEWCSNNNIHTIVVCPYESMHTNLTRNGFKSCQWTSDEISDECAKYKNYHETWFAGPHKIGGAGAYGDAGECAGTPWWYLELSSKFSTVCRKKLVTFWTMVASWLDLNKSSESVGQRVCADLHFPLQGAM